MRPSRTLLAAVLLVPGAVVAVGLATALPAAASICTTRTAGDVNHDGHPDALIGQVDRIDSAVVEAGAVNLLRGSTAGLTTSGNQFVEQSGLGSTDSPGTDDEFGFSVVTGFFDGDCYADVAIGVPGDDSGAGSVVVIKGSASGLSLASAVRFRAAQINASAAAVGAALAVGDVNHDGYDDLVVGAPLSNGHAGAIAVLRGSSSGLTLTNRQWFAQDTAGVAGAAAPNNFFGSSLATGDFNGDHVADVAIGAPGVTVGTEPEAGTVTELNGSGSGLTATGSKAFSQASPGVVGSAEVGDEWPSSLAAGDITGDGRADLVAGDAYEGIGDIEDAGSVIVLKGSSSGLTGTGSQLWDQNTDGVPGTAETDDLFGYAVSVGDYNGDKHADVAVGVPGEGVGSVDFAGTVDVLYGAGSGLTATGAQAWTQNTTGIDGTAEANDQFGFALTSAPFAGTTRADLVIGVPGEDSDAFTDSGAIAVLRGSSGGLTATGNQFFDAITLAGGAQNSAGFGLSVG